MNGVVGVTVEVAKVELAAGLYVAVGTVTLAPLAHRADLPVGSRVIEPVKVRAPPVTVAVGVSVTVVLPPVPDLITSVTVPFCGMVLPAGPETTALRDQALVAPTGVVLDTTEVIVVAKVAVAALTVTVIVPEVEAAEVALPAN